MIPVEMATRQGRRATDWVIQLYRGARANTLAIFQIWKDERGYWSTRRILLWIWTILGAWVIYREVTARVYVVRETIITPHFLSNAWIQAWAITEGAFIVAVFGPVVADYLKNAAPALTAISTALRERAAEVAGPKLPQAGVAPSNPEIRKALGEYSPEEQEGF